MLIFGVQKHSTIVGKKEKYLKGNVRTFMYIMESLNIYQRPKNNDE